MLPRSPIPQDVRIEPVGPAGRAAMVRFLVSGRRQDLAGEFRAEQYDRLLGRGGQGCWFYAARRGSEPTAAALVTTAPGRVGMLHFSPATAPGVVAADLPPTVQAAARAAVDAGLSFVQALVGPERKEDIEALAEAGLGLLAELIYMRLDLRAASTGGTGEGWTWRNGRQFDAERLAAVLSGTYEQSLDCPQLAGLRAPEDVIASHRASGRYSPRSWWIAEREGAPAGCVLVNDSTREPGAMDIVYLGVLPAFRGRGLARAMVRRAARWARRRGKGALTVVVDAANLPARGVYDSVGFYETDRRQAWFLPGRPRGERAGC